MKDHRRYEVHKHVYDPNTMTKCRDLRRGETCINHVYPKAGAVNPFTISGFQMTHKNIQV